MFVEKYTQFIDRIYSLLSGHTIDASVLKIDHLGYQADSAADYDKCTLEMAAIAEKVSENMVGGRRVGIFKLNKPLKYADESFQVVEIFEPREGQVVKSDWEHIELLTPGSLEDFMHDYQTVQWDTSMIDREEFSMLILRLDSDVRAKFPRRGVLEELKR